MLSCAHFLFASLFSEPCALRSFVVSFVEHKFIDDIGHDFQEQLEKAIAGMCPAPTLPPTYHPHSSPHTLSPHTPHTHPHTSSPHTPHTSSPHIPHTHIHHPHTHHTRTSSPHTHPTHTPSPSSLYVLPYKILCVSLS